MKRVLKEPLLHFAVLGVALFAWFKLTADPVQTEDPKAVSVSDAALSQMVAQYQSVWKRPPSEEELASLAQNAIREEVMVREALALGLDRGDAVIRNRLRQKMQFLTDSAAQSMEPGDDVLRAHLADNADRFLTQATVSFDQVYLGQSPAEQEVQAALQALRSGGDPAAFGRGALLPPQIADATRTQVDGGFGTGFFDELAGMEPGSWQGPVRSGYGLHIVRVTGVIPAKLPEFSEIRDKLLFDWRSAQAQALSDAQFEALSARYDVIMPRPDALQKALVQ